MSSQFPVLPIDLMSFNTPWAGWLVCIAVVCSLATLVAPHFFIGSSTLDHGRDPARYSTEDGTTSGSLEHLFDPLVEATTPTQSLAREYGEFAREANFNEMATWSAPQVPTTSLVQV